MKYIAIIPALKKNRYSKKGDLHSWGGSNLLEWKISQVKKIRDQGVTTKIRERPRK